MNQYKVFTIKKGLKEENDKIAHLTREELRKKGVFLINMMSSPGSGKTSTLVSTIKLLKDSMKIGVMEADIDSDVDAKSVEDAGANTL